jgi:hypothetical protein
MGLTEEDVVPKIQSTEDLVIEIATLTRQKLKKIRGGRPDP